MEAHLIYAHKVKNITTEKREWRIINPLKFGIRVDESQIPEKCTKFFNANIAPDVSHFLTEIAGEGGPWDGWTLYAVGNWMHTAELMDPTPHFQIVFARKERTAEERASEECEVVGAKEGLKDEDFPVLRRGHTPATNGK